ncbi:MAG: DUF4345 domain-containing protein [Chloroflexi bacterium]|nr:DUF4345 domain-containing protein [Chloroflexota bacterium]
MVIDILRFVAALGTIAVGVYSLVRPDNIRGFTGLEATGPRGITEIRAVLGGVFIGLGGAALLLDAPPAYQMLGITYLVVALIRCFSMFLDRSVVTSNVLSALVEIVFGIILMV